MSSPPEGIEATEDVNLRLSGAWLHPTLAALHQAGRHVAASAVLQKGLPSLLQLGNGGLDQGSTHVQGWRREGKEVEIKTQKKIHFPLPKNKGLSKLMMTGRISNQSS